MSRSSGSSRFRALRDRDRFRAWLVRATWRLALDRRRNDRRRQARDEIAEVPQAESVENRRLTLTLRQGLPLIHRWIPIVSEPIESTSSPS
jgi:DNA-directed RNA polymerase specialized sigma24 family protein